MDREDLTANYLHLQRLSTEDGPGIRTTVFLKGCSLRCAWCHNPESISSKQQLQWLEHLCIACQTCVSNCASESIQFDDKLRIEISSCTLCGTCVDICPTNALEMLGGTINAEQLTTELLKDKAFFRTSKGGVTFSGGEPALQAEFCTAVMEELQQQGIHTALDTCLQVPTKKLKQILPHTDLVMIDVKLMDAETHREYTGVGTELIIENIKWLASYIRQEQPSLRLWVRTPLIPGVTNNKENLQAIGHFLNNELQGLIERWELCAFNNLCQDKYRRLNMPWQFQDTPLLTREELDENEKWAKEIFHNPDLVWVTGAAKTEREGTRS